MAASTIVIFLVSTKAIFVVVTRLSGQFVLVFEAVITRHCVSSLISSCLKIIGQTKKIGKVLEAIRDSASPKLQRYWELAPKVLFTSHSG